MTKKRKPTTNDELTMTMTLTEQEMRSAVYAAMVCMIRDCGSDALILSHRELENTRGKVICITMGDEVVTYSLVDMADEDITGGNS